MSVSGDSSLRQVSSPWLMLPPSYSDGGMSYNFYSLAENRVFSLKKKSNLQSESPKDDSHIVGSSHGWLALYNTSDDRLFLSNPITGEHIRLPPLETLDISAVQRVILSSSPHQQDCRVIILYDSRNLAVCSPGRSGAWTTTYEWSYYSYEDVVYSTTHGRFFSLKDFDSEPYDMEGWDATNPSSPNIADVVSFRYEDDDDNYWFHDRSKLDVELFKLYGSWPTLQVVHVEHTGQLLHVKRYFVGGLAPDGSPIKDRGNRREYTYKTVAFHVYVIDNLLRTTVLRHLEDSLDGLALFVGHNHSFALRAADYPELKPDSIYFTDYDKPFEWRKAWPDYKYGGHDIGIFDYKNKTISPCYYPCDHRSFKNIFPSPLWFTPSPH